MKRIITTLIGLFFTPGIFAQENQPEMADNLRGNGKIYVVVLVLSIVFICLATYLVIIDRKLRKLEEKK